MSNIHNDFLDEMAAAPDTIRTQPQECSDCGEDRNYCECDEMEAELMGLRFDDGYDSDLE